MGLTHNIGLMLFLFPAKKRFERDAPDAGKEPRSPFLLMRFADMNSLSMI